MDLISPIMTMLFVVMIATRIMYHWENKKRIARFDELSEKDFRGELTPEEQEEYQDLIHG